MDSTTRLAGRSHHSQQAFTPSESPLWPVAPPPPPTPRAPSARSSQAASQPGARSLSLGHHWHGNCPQQRAELAALAREPFGADRHSPVRLSRSRRGAPRIGANRNHSRPPGSADAHGVKAALNRMASRPTAARRVDGRSLRRFLRLAELVREGGERPAVALLLRLGWERAESKTSSTSCWRLIASVPCWRWVARRYGGAGGS